MTTRNTAHKKALQTMRNLVAQGFTDETVLTNAAADALGNGPDAMKTARAVWERNYAIMAAV